MLFDFMNDFGNNLLDSPQPILMHTISLLLFGSCLVLNCDAPEQTQEAQ